MATSQMKTTNSSDPRGERKRRNLLRALHELGGKAKTSDITDEVGFDDDGVRYHAGKLENDTTEGVPLVKLAGKEKSDHGIDPNVYRLTDRGRDVLEAMGEEAFSISDAETFVELRSEVARLRKSRSELEATVESQSEEIAELREDHESLLEKHDTLVELIKESDDIELF